MNLSKSITLNTLVSAFARVCGGVLALASIGLITRALGREGFGEYATVIAYLSTFGILADLGLYTLMTREMARPEGKDSQKEIVSLFFSLRLFVAVFFLAAAILFALFFPYSSQVKLGIAFTAIAYLFMSLSQIFMGVFQNYLRMGWPALAEIAGRAVQLGLVWLFFVSGKGLFSYLAAVVASSFVIFLINISYARRLVDFHVRVSMGAWKKILRTTFPIAVSLVFTLLYFKSDTIILSILKSPQEVGIYNVAYKLLETIIFFPAMFVGIMMPLLSDGAARGGREFAKIFRRVFDVLSMFALPTAIGGILLASPIVALIGGSEFLASALPLQILFIAIAIIFYGNLAGSSVIALNLQGQAMSIYFGGMVFNIAANFFVIPALSYVGAAWTTVITEFFITLFLFALIWRKTRILPSITITGKAGFAAACMALVVYALIHPAESPIGALPLFLVVFGGAIVYGLTLFILGAVKKGELQQLFHS